MSTLKQYDELRTVADVKKNARIIQKRLNWFQDVETINLRSFDLIPIDLLESLQEVLDLIEAKMLLLQNQRTLLQYGKGIQRAHQLHLIQLMELFDQFEMLRNKILDKHVNA